MSPKSKPRSISIRDVAQRAGVSLGSASRVINNAANVTEDTRRRVLAAIDELGYRPNHAAQSLRLRSSRTIGCLLTDVTNPLYARLFRALEEQFLAEGYMLLLANGLNDARREIDILSTFRARGMDGVILAPGNERDPEVLAAIEALPVPAVILDRDIRGSKDRVLFEQVAGMRHATGELLALGHRRIALVLGQTPLAPSRRPMRRRIEGFHAAYAEHGLAAPDDACVVRVDESLDSAFERVRALLQSPDRPTAVIAQGTNILNECLNAISASGLRIPADVSVVTIGDPVFARTFLPPLSASRLSANDIARACAHLLLSRIRGEAGPEPRTLRVSMTWIGRESCAPPPAGAR
ncbi:LacI family DNA-binding transcriptional regulator [Verticiella sediminum]|uniref:LacI family DNA-binding transcriptional regulator n=1 Tax=Verticiella sediminum TaxID=1247510 RepID=A0A556B119_9BURK|nr:LacI family DNA-binding transcriptional regulator [Verticiella sediminum]TSH98862.1 LacI family DNA-binding transcriptional regulator [Verticiella sediminum]